MTLQAFTMTRGGSPLSGGRRRFCSHHQKIADNPALPRLREAFDLRCDIWFSPGDNLDPIPTHWRPPEFPQAPEHHILPLYTEQILVRCAEATQ